MREKGGKSFFRCLPLALVSPWFAVSLLFSFFTALLQKSDSIPNALPLIG